MRPPSARPPPSAAPAATAPAASTLCYFAFGANMAASTLVKRGVTPHRSEPATVADPHTALEFGHRGGFATLVTLPPPPPEPPATGDLRWRQPPGVLHTLTAADLERLKQREVGYRLAEVLVETRDGRRTTAAAFVSSPLLRLYRPVPPLRRYRDLLLEGARQQGLDAEYVAWLERIEVAPAADARHDACPATTLAQLMAASALGAVTWACVQL